MGHGKVRWLCSEISGLMVFFPQGDDKKGSSVSKLVDTVISVIMMMPFMSHTRLIKAWHLYFSGIVFVNIKVIFVMWRL